MENNTNYSDSRIGKVLNIKDDAAEPVMECVKEKDKELGGIAVERLSSAILRIEALEEEKKKIAKRFRDVFSEAKGSGFDVKIMRAVLKLRKMYIKDRYDRDVLLEAYRSALQV